MTGPYALMVCFLRGLPPPALPGGFSSRIVCPLMVFDRSGDNRDPVAERWAADHPAEEAEYRRQVEAEREATEARLASTRPRRTAALRASWARRKAEAAR